MVLLCLQSGSESEISSIAAAGGGVCANVLFVLISVRARGSVVRTYTVLRPCENTLVVSLDSFLH